jgi:photosystem II stability/assembly factor-like uncharacterized protein
MKSYIFLFLILAGFTSAFAQDIPPRQETPNYILRNNDFQDKRATPSFENFGKEYFKSHKQLLNSQVKSKKTNSWIPKGPYGTDDLAGIGRVNSMQLHPTDTNTWYICVAQGGLWKTSNAGESWTSISGDLPILRTSYLAIHPNNPDIMYVALGDFAYLGHNLQANENKRNSHYGLGVYKTVNGGQTWSPTGLSFDQTDFEGSLTAKIFIHPNNPDTVIAVGQVGSYLSYDGGASFTKTDSRLFWDLEKHPSKPNTLFASTGYVHSYKLGTAGILKSEDFGATWSSASTPIPASNRAQRIELAVSPSDPNFVYAIACDTLGGFYGFYKSTDEGLSFSTKLDNSYQYNILNNSLDGDPGGQGRYDLAISVDRNDKNKVLIGGINIWQTTDGGSSFHPITYWLLNYYKTSLHGDIQEIVQHPTNSTYFVCHDGGFSRSFNIIEDNVTDLKDNTHTSKTVWTNYTKGLNITSFYRLSINQDNGDEMMAGAQDNSTVYTAGDSIYFNLSGGDGMESVFADETFYRYTSSQNGNINAYSIFSGGFSYEGRISPPSGEYGEWTTPFVLANYQLFIGYSNLHIAEGPYIYNTLTSNIGNIPITALDVQNSDAKRIYFAKRGYSSLDIQNSMFTSSDKGSTWQSISDGLPRTLYPGYIEMNQAKPEQVWVVFPGFNKDNKVFGSINGGTTWTNMTYDLPNVPVNCIVYQEGKSKILYIGTDIGVFYLLPNTTTWVSYNDDLPKVIVSELEIDYTDTSLVAATFGRGLWEIPALNIATDTTDGTDNIIEYNQLDLTLSPNPSFDFLNLSWGLSTRPTSISIIDITGKVIFHTKNIQGSNELKYDVSPLPGGQYFVILKSSTGRGSTSFIKE